MNNSADIVEKIVIAIIIGFLIMNGFLVYTLYFMFSYAVYTIPAVLLFVYISYRSSKLNNKMRNYIGYGIPVLLLLAAQYFYWAQTNSGCESTLEPCFILVFGLPRFLVIGASISFYSYMKFIGKWSGRIAYYSAIGFLLFMVF